MILSQDGKDGHYEEVGQELELSNKIKFYRTAADGNWKLAEDKILTFVVRGVSQDEV